MEHSNLAKHILTLHSVRKSLPGVRLVFSMILVICGHDDHDISKRELHLGTSD